MLGAYVREDNVRDKDKVWKARWGEAAACGRADELVSDLSASRRAARRAARAAVAVAVDAATAAAALERARTAAAKAFAASTANEGSPWHECARSPLAASRAAPRASRFEAAMRGGGVLAFAVPSAVAADPAITMAQLLDSMAFSSKFRAGGVASTERRAGRVVAASYISARVPNTFCAQPLWDHESCGSYDSLLLVNASRLAVAACGAALHDAGCRNLCTATIPDAEACHECSAYKGRATHKDPHKDVLSCAFRGASWRRDLERAMRGVRSTCDANGGSWRPWKPPWDTLMSSEVQLRAETIREGLIEDALLAVGTIVVDDPVATLAWQRQKLDAARHTRPCRSRLVAKRVAAKLGRPIEEWRFTIDASRGLRVAQPPRSYPMVPLRGNRHYRQSLQFPVATDYGGLWVPPATAWATLPRRRPWTRGARSRGAEPPGRHRRRGNVQVWVRARAPPPPSTARAARRRRSSTI